MKANRESTNYGNLINLPIYRRRRMHSRASHFCTFFPTRLSFSFIPTIIGLCGERVLHINTTEIQQQMKWNVRARSRADATQTDGEQNEKREKSAPDAAGWIDGWLVPALIVLPFVLSFSNRHMPFLLFISLLYFRNFILFSEEKSMGRIIVVAAERCSHSHMDKKILMRCESRCDIT